MRAVISANVEDLSCVCDEIARTIKSAESSAIFLLNGDIGAGKTTLVKAFARYVGIKESVTSPTFSLLHIYGSLNSSLGMQFRTCGKFWESADLGPALSQNFSQIQKPHRNPKDLRAKRSNQYFDFDSQSESLTNQTQIAESSLDSANSQNLDKNNLAQSANLETRPLRGAKNRKKASSSASADFLLEAEKRGTPPKSEKRSFWETHLNVVGGSGGKGVQPFCEKESSEIDGEGGAESSKKLPQDDEFALDSANSQNLTLYHYDLYQKGVDSAIDLGLLDLLGESGIHFVEWGDERLFNILKDAFENIFIIQIIKAKNDRIYEFKSEF